MNENNELNDIILNKKSSVGNNKKIILAVATLGVILIFVVILMNSISSTGTDNLPQAVLPPEPKAQPAQTIKDEPLFEEVEIIEENSNGGDNLDKIAKKLKEESLSKTIVKKEVVKPKVITKPKPKVKPKANVVHKKAVTKNIANGKYFIQVGSFSKYKPNKKFLKSITDLGYNYEFYKTTKNSKNLNKVLVGPFSTEALAKDARRVLRAKIEPGAFLTKIK